MNSNLRILLIAGLILLAATVDLPAQAPQLLNFQGKLAVDGSPLSGDHFVTFRIYPLSSGGTSLWSEKRTVSVNDGVFNVLLGSVTALPDNLFTGSGDRYLGVQVGAGDEMTPRFRISSAAYAVRAGLADAVKAGAVDSDALADEAVTGSKIVTGAITGPKVAPGAIGHDEIKDMTRHIWVPASALNYDASSANVYLANQGVGFKATFQTGASATVAMPADWDSSSPMFVELYFYPTTNSTGNVDFFIRAHGRSIGNAITDPGSIGSDGAVSVSNDIFRVQRQRFTIQTDRVPADSELFQIFGIQRQGPGESYTDDVVVLGVKIIYLAKR